MMFKSITVLSLVAAAVIAGTAHAEGEAAQTLLNALTNCPANTNPMNALKSLGGNVLGNPRFVADGEGAVEFDVVRDPRVMNVMIGAPTVLLGTGKIEMKYSAPGYGLVCAVETKSNQ
jgi:hypothetical protein